MLIEPSSVIRIGTKHFFIESITEALISDRYISWLNNPGLNQFLEARKTRQDYNSICKYINYLRQVPRCDLLSISTIQDHCHVGNVTFTPGPDSSTGVYGIFIGDHHHPNSLIAGAEVSFNIIDFLFESFNYERLLEGVMNENLRAIRLLQKFGFTLFEKNEYSAYYELTKDDWLSNHRTRLFKIFG
jgi:ribosomal-protein-alanine N-acetyltransferase